jgi:hypothetical protein
VNALRDLAVIDLATRGLLGACRPDGRVNARLGPRIKGPSACGFANRPSIPQNLEKLTRR